MDRTYFSVTRLDKAELARVADQRLKDVQALIDTRKAQHANAALYLLGYVMEILLKAELVAQHPSMADRTMAPQGRLRDMIWREHNWVRILEHEGLQQVQSALVNRQKLDGKPHLRRLQHLGALWTIEIRYSSAKISLNEVRKYARWVGEVKEVFQ